MIDIKSNVGWTWVNVYGEVGVDLLFRAIWSPDDEGFVWNGLNGIQPYLQNDKDIQHILSNIIEWHTKLNDRLEDIQRGCE